jgi:hypothetical protein
MPRVTASEVNGPGLIGYRARVPAADGEHLEVVWTDATTALCIHVWEEDSAAVALRTVALVAHGREFRFRVRTCEKCTNLDLGDR